MTQTLHAILYKSLESIILSLPPDTTHIPSPNLRIPSLLQIDQHPIHTATIVSVLTDPAFIIPDEDGDVGWVLLACDETGAGRGCEGVVFVFLGGGDRGGCDERVVREGSEALKGTGTEVEDLEERLATTRAIKNHHQASLVSSSPNPQLYVSNTHQIHIPIHLLDLLSPTETHAHLKTYLTSPSFTPQHLTLLLSHRLTLGTTFHRLPPSMVDVFHAAGQVHPKDVEAERKRVEKVEAKRVRDVILGGR
ncbi:hypothetical protein BC829DRAFT_445798 [Chytridium lagenaria]|nr:hypothetical protein BC829DRAFT_445798 [Chytridium lagenaria]